MQHVWQGTNRVYGTHQLNGDEWAWLRLCVHSSGEEEALLMDITHLVMTADKNDEYLIIWQVWMYQPYLLLQPQIERGLRTEQGSASLKSCIFTSKDFLTSMSFPLNPTTSSLHGSNPGQWRCFCAAETVDNCLNLAKAECLLAASLGKTSCPCSFTNVLSVPGRTGRNHWCCFMVGDLKETVTFPSFQAQ